MEGITAAALAGAVHENRAQTAKVLHMTEREVEAFACGIAAGARPVLNAFLEEVAKRELKNVTVSQTGCIGVCRLEPIVEVYVPGQEKVTYVKMTPDKVASIVSEHLVNGRVVTEYTIGAAE